MSIAVGTFPGSSVGESFGPPSLSPCLDGVSAFTDLPYSFKFSTVRCRLVKT
jgi:hypothetical protein